MIVTFIQLKGTESEGKALDTKMLRNKEGASICDGDVGLISFHVWIIYGLSMDYVHALLCHKQLAYLSRQRKCCFSSPVKRKQ